MRPRAVKLTVGGSMVVIALTALLLSLLMPKGPKGGAEAIRVARDYAKRIKPSYPYDEYEAAASWDGVARRWEVRFVASRPYIHTLIGIDYATGECRAIPVSYHP